MVSSAVIAALLSAGFAGFTTYRAGVREALAEKRYPPEGRILDVDGVKVHALVQGDGPDLVLIHGSSGSLRDFTFALMPLLAKRYRVIAVDRPGHGWSDDVPDSESLRVQAEIIQRAVKLLGADRPIVLGQSYGGSVALAWAVHFPDELVGLVTTAAPSHPWSTGLGAYYTITSHPLGQILAIPMLTAFVPDSKVASEVDAVFAPQSAPKGYAQHFGPGMTLRRGAMRANSRQRRELKAEIIEMSELYDHISVPVEIIHGTADTTVHAEIHAKKMVKDTKLANLTLLDGIGHMPHHVSIGEVALAVDRAATRAGLRAGGK